MENLMTPSGDLCYEIERLLTFSENIHPTLTATELAANGFYYDSTEGKILCFICGSVLEFSDSTFKHKYSCEHKVDNCPVYLHNDTDIENAAAFNVQNTEQENEIVVTTSTENIIPNENEMLDMQKRLDSFENWNKSIPVTPTGLAKNGFYYLGYGDAVKCAYCSVQLRNWKENDDVHKEHRNFSPKCPNLESSMKMDFKYELNRLRSFAKALSTPLPLKAKDLAANGFYYKGPTDNACCVFCKCEINDWKANDDIKEKHRSISPNCPFLCEKLVGNVPIPNQSNKFYSPVHPHFTSLSERLKTFSSWPKNKNQKPESLADAGFFHNGKADTVICFSCDGGLCNWEEDDNPWEEHIRWFPRCTFVQKESSYTRKEKVMDATLQVQTESFESDTMGGFRNMEDNTTISDALASAFHKPKLSYMETPTVLAVLSMGYKRNTVKRIVKNKIKETGSCFSQASDLLVAIENSPHFNDDDDDKEELVHAAIKNYSETSATASADLIAENNMLKEQKLCKICLDEDLNVVFLPCGHLVSCVSCAAALSNCPLCRKIVHGMVKIFF
ncbi:baculoviral IAP repeat-containing protein 7-A [Octopus vulgaris]|uniref:Baculoviral IAP repeat-containing protein 7-A n=1 Tax=Octopus vulgaris TaxID=6645 RepID=A0AA36EXV7_OCTVU|nr:baculoviral IAP repeat-containing protein 7-A [Octopus vulgaris]